MEEHEIPDHPDHEDSQQDKEDFCEVHGHDLEEGWVPPYCVSCGWQDEL